MESEMKVDVSMLPSLSMEPGITTHRAEAAVNGLARQITIAIAVFIAEKLD